MDRRFFLGSAATLVLIRPNTIVFFLSALYDAQKNSGSPQPEKFDAAYLITCYSKEYDIPEIPAFVKKQLCP